MNQTQQLCCECGRPARVRILETYLAGEPVIKHFCFHCADGYFGESTRQDLPPVHRPSLGSLMVLAGLFIGLISLLGDHLGVHSDSIFGWYKQSELVAGILLVCLGAFWRVDVIGVVGLLLIALVFSANLLGLSGLNGFGWKHKLALAVGLTLIFAGVLVRHLYYRHSRLQ